MSLLDLITGGKSSEASGDLEKALQAIQQVRTPTVEDLKFQIQKLVEAGKLSPQQAKTYLQSPNALLSEVIPQTGTNAQVGAIGALQDAAARGGLNPAEQAKIDDIVQQLGTQERGANEAVVQNQAARGALTGGETLAAQLGNNESATINANQLGRGTAADAYTQMLNELTSAGQLGAGLQGQENTQANTVGAATNAINQFNTTQQQQEENLNTQNENTSREFNLENEQRIGDTNATNANQHALQQSQLPEEVFGNELEKAGMEAGVNKQQADLSTGQGKQNAGIWSAAGQLLGPQLAPSFQQIGNNVAGSGAGSAAGQTGVAEAGGSTVGTYAPSAAEMGFSKGGMIHDYLNGGAVDGVAKVPGDSRENDTVKSMLSPKEIVIPRSAAIPSMQGDDSKVMAFLQRLRQKKEPAPVHPHDVATILHALGRVRELPHA